MDTLIHSDEPLTARVPFQQIAQLNHMQQEMAEAGNDEDEEENRGAHQVAAPCAACDQGKQPPG